jgi:phosphoglycerate dehydrogenase-like enzyme
MKLRCAILDDYQNAALALADWSALADAVEVTVFSEHIPGEDDLVRAIGECEILVIMRERTPFPARLFARLPKLKLLVTTGPRNASIDLAAAKDHGVVVCGTESQGHPPTELTWALILGLARGLVPENRALREGGPWQSTIGMDLAGSHLGLIGLGKLGTKVAKIGLAFDMKVSAWSQNLTSERAEAAGVRLAGYKEELLESADFVSIHLVLGERTRALVGEPELRRMRRTAYLINTSRAGIVDQNALARALEERWIAGAGLDVFETEPLPHDSIWRRLDNVLATPHIGYVSQSNYRIFFSQAVEDIRAFLAGAPVRVLA